MYWILLSCICFVFQTAMAEEFVGKVLTVTEIQFVVCPEPHLQVLLKESNNEVFVDIGPRRLYEAKGVSIQPNDQLSIQGNKIEIYGQCLIQAECVEKKGVTIYIEDNQGLQYKKCY